MSNERSGPIATVENYPEALYELADDPWEEKNPDEALRMKKSLRRYSCQWFRGDPYTLG